MPSAPARHHRLLVVSLALLMSCTSQDEGASRDGRVDGGSSDGETAQSEVDDELFPERVGEAVVVASGGEPGAGWEVTAQESVEGTCLLVDDELGEQTEGCGFEVPDRHDVGFLDHEGGESFDNSPNFRFEGTRS